VGLDWTPFDRQDAALVHPQHQVIALQVMSDLQIRAVQDPMAKAPFRPNHQASHSLPSHTPSPERRTRGCHRKSAGAHADTDQVWECPEKALAIQWAVLPGLRTISP
jgi:hypothetical protein